MCVCKHWCSPSQAVFSPNWIVSALSYGRYSSPSSLWPCAEIPVGCPCFIYWREPSTPGVSHQKGSIQSLNLQAAQLLMQLPSLLQGHHSGFCSASQELQVLCRAVSQQVSPHHHVLVLEYRSSPHTEFYISFCWTSWVFCWPLTPAF